MLLARLVQSQIWLCYAPSKTLDPFLVIICYFAAAVRQKAIKKLESSRIKVGYFYLSSSTSQLVVYISNFLLCSDDPVKQIICGWLSTISNLAADYLFKYFGKQLCSLETIIWTRPIQEKDSLLTDVLEIRLIISLCLVYEPLNQQLHCWLEESHRFYFSW